MTLAAAAAAALALGACGEKPEPSPPPAPAAVTGTIDMRRAPAPPDAGTQGGHGGGGYRATTADTRFTFSGSVRPADASLSTHPAARLQASVRREGTRFHVTVARLARGENEVELVARAPGARPWRERVTIIRD